MLENNLRKALILSRGDFWTFLERPISAVCLVLAALVLLTPLLPILSRKREVIALDKQ
jgi:putative tricarboxylic transport membrane protein